MLRLSGMPFQLAFVIGYVCGITAHFGLHRYFTFAGEDEYALEAPSQAKRFVVTVVAQYVIIAVGVAVLTPLLGVRDLVVYIALILLDVDRELPHHAPPDLPLVSGVSGLGTGRARSLHP